MKKNQKFKVTPAIDAEITHLVATLPVLPLFTKAGQPVYKNTAVPGTYLIEHGVHKDTKGAAIDPRTMYMSPILQYTDHRTHLITAYKEFGREGLEKYEAQVKEIQSAKQKEMMDASPWHVRFINWLKFWK